MFNAFSTSSISLFEHNLVAYTRFEIPTIANFLAKLPNVICLLIFQCH